MSKGELGSNKMIVAVQNLPGGPVTPSVMPGGSAQHHGVHVTARYKPNGKPLTSVAEEARLFGRQGVASSPRRTRARTTPTTRMANARGHYYMGCKNAENPELLLKCFILAATLLMAAPSLAGGAEAPAAPASKARRPWLPRSLLPPGRDVLRLWHARRWRHLRRSPAGDDVADVRRGVEAYLDKQFAAGGGSQVEPPDPDPFSFSVYRGLRPEPMGEQTIINGAKMHIATLIVDGLAATGGEGTTSRCSSGWATARWWASAATRPGCAT